MPTLHFLPSLTPVEDSLKLLRAAYAVLLKLGDTLYPTDEKRPSKLKLLDRTMRQGVLQGFLYSRDNVHVSQLLVEEADTLICRMGIHAVKHLKVRLPLGNLPQPAPETIGRTLYHYCRLSFQSRLVLPSLVIF
jgi:Tti2 family